MDLPAITSCVAASSAAASWPGLTSRTAGPMLPDVAGPRVLSAARFAATRAPSSAPDASRIAMFRTSAVGFDRVASQAGKSMAAESNTGTMKVMTRNQRERTRSVNSRFATISSLLSAMSAHPRLHAGHADALQEDLVQRRLHQLEPFDAGARVDQATQQPLRVRVRRELDLEKARGLV